MTRTEQLLKIRAKMREMRDGGASEENLDDFAKQVGVTPEDFEGLPSLEDSPGMLKSGAAGIALGFTDVDDMLKGAQEATTGRVVDWLAKQLGSTKGPMPPRPSSSDWFQDFMGVYPQTYGEQAMMRGGRMLAPGALTMLPVGRGLKALGTAGGLTGRIGTKGAEMLMNPYAQRLGRSLGRDVLAAGGAGLLGQKVEDEGGGALAQMGAEMLGGISPGVVSAAFRKAASVSPHGIVARTVIKNTPGTKHHGAKTARKTLEKAGVTLEDMDKLVAPKDLGDVPIDIASNKSPFMALGKYLRDLRGDVDDPISREIQQAREELVPNTGELGKSGSGKAALQTKKQKEMEAVNREYESLRQNISDRVYASIKRAESVAKRAAPDADRIQIGRAYYSELDNALKEVNRQEKELWGLVNRDLDVGFDETAKVIRDSSLSDVRRDFIPAYVQKWLESASPTKPVSTLTPQKNIPSQTRKLGELQDLRSRVLEESRIARSRGEFNPANVLENVADALLKDMEKSPAHWALDMARDFSHHKNDLFRRSIVGDILGYTREGGPKTSPQMAAYKGLGGGGPETKLAMEQAEAAVAAPGMGPNSPSVAQIENAKDAVLRTQTNAEDYIKNLYYDNPSEGFFRSNRELLAEYPNVAKTLRDDFDARMAREETWDAGGRGIERNLKEEDAAIDALRGDLEGAYAFSPYGKEFQGILNSTDPYFSAKQLIDQNPQIADKIRSDFMQIATKGSLDVSEKSGMQAAKGILTEAQFNRLETLARNAKLHSQYKEVSKINSLPGLANWAADTLVRLASLAGAHHTGKTAGKLGFPIGVGGLSLAGRYSARAGKWFQDQIQKEPHRILNEIVLEGNTDLGKIILAGKNPTPKQLAKVRQWITSPQAAAIYGAPPSEEEE